MIGVPPPVGYAHPTEPQCSYDPVEGLALAPETDPMEKIRLLESEVGADDLCQPLMSFAYPSVKLNSR
jgi:hypothetical protein